MIKLLIGGFPLDRSELKVVQLVAFNADVRTIKIVRDKKTRICKGYAFLEIADRAVRSRLLQCCTVQVGRA